MESPENRSGLPSGPVAILIVILGLTGAWITWSPESARESAKIGSSVRAPTITAIPAVTTPAEALMPSPLLRPVALISSALTPEPMFWLPHAGEPAPSNLFAIPQNIETNESAVACANRISDFLPANQKVKDCALMARVQKLAIQRRAHVTFVIATLPDWIDSSLQWGFDPIIASIQTLAGQLRYSLAAFDLVDTEPPPQDVQPRGSVWPYPKVHELTPGILLFRRDTPNSPPDASDVDLLAILLVGETATAGAHPAALANALDLVIEWEVAARGDGVRTGTPAITVQVLGPTYSGSALPLRIALDEAARRHAGAGPISFSVVTGSATDPRNAARLHAADNISFRSTTRPDPDELHALSQYFGRVNRRWQCGIHVGLLVEANTSWGQDVANSPSSGGTDTQASTPLDTRQSCELCRKDPGIYYNSSEPKPFPCAAVARFPLHISRLRAESQHALAIPGRDIPSRATVTLDLSESESPADRVSAETPKITAAAEETMLAGMFDVLGDDRISAIGIFATDKRDHIYLAEEVARHRPNVLPFTVESSLLYLHPDVAGYVQGTLVASTYSLNPRTQQLTQPGLVSPTQFTASSAHGIYNALALLLGEPKYMVDYAPPWFPGSKGESDPETRCDKGDCAPPVWVSVVGRRGLLPIYVDTVGACSPSEADARKYVACKPGVGKPDVGPFQTRRPFLATRRFVILALAGSIGIMIMIQLLAQRTRMQLAGALDSKRKETQRIRWQSVARSWFRSTFSLPSTSLRSSLYTQESNCAMAAAAVATVTLTLYLLKLFCIYLCDWFAFSPLIGQLIFFPFAVAGLVYVTSVMYLTFWPNQQFRTASCAGFFFVAIVLLLMAPGPVVDTPVLAALFNGAHGLPGTVLGVVAVLCAGVAVFGDTLSETQKITRWRRVPVLLGIAAFAGLWLDLTVYHWEPTEAFLYANRASSLDSLVSPVTFVTLTSISLFWWGIWSLRRIQLLVLPEIEIGIGPLLERSARIAALDPKALFRSPAQPIGVGNVAISTLLLGLLLYGSHAVGSIDGWPFSAFMLFGASCLFAITVHTLVQCLLLGRGVLAVLHTLARMPGADAFKKIGDSGFPWQISFQEPRFGQLEPLFRRLERVVLYWLGTPDERLRRSARILRALLSRLRRFHATEVGPQPLRCIDWRALNRIVRSFDARLSQTLWDAGVPADNLDTAARTALDDMEYVVFFHAAIVLRDLVTRLVSAFTIVFGSFLLLLISHLTYTFQGRVFWLTFDAMAIAMATTIGVRQLFALERDTIMRNLWRTTPGRISLFRGLTWRMVGYGLLAVCTLLVVFFPELLGNLDSWVSSARGVLR